jgi:hypothetical protein
MRGLLFGAVCAAAFAIHAAPGQAACLSTLNWHGYTYLGYGSTGLKAGEALALPARVPSCDDTVGPEGPKPVTYRDKSVNRVRGVEPSIAVRGGTSVYVNQSTFPALRSHPLHERLKGGWKWNRGRGERCRVEGPAVVDPTGLSVDGAKVVVQRDTNVELQRHGTGFVPPGTVVRVYGRCVTPNGGDLVWLRATRIARVR